jgi:hypothetical protein
MRMERLVRRALACGALGVGAITGACLSPDWPPTVESGPVGAGRAGGASIVSDASTSEPDGDSFEDAGGDSSALGTASAGQTCTLATGVCQIVKATGSTGWPCNGTIGAAGSMCPTTNLVGCCTVMNGADDIESCYNSAQQTGGTAMSCAQMGGSFSAAQ